MRSLGEFLGALESLFGSSADHSGGSNDVLLTPEVAAVAEPVEGRVAEDVDEAHDGDDVGDAGSGGVGDGTLNRWEAGGRSVSGCC